MKCSSVILQDLRRKDYIKEMAYEEPTFNKDAVVGKKGGGEKGFLNYTYSENGKREKEIPWVEGQFTDD